MVEVGERNLVDARAANEQTASPGEATGDQNTVQYNNRITVKFAL